MSLRRRALFLAGIFVAVSCSDAGNPMGPRGPEGPEPGPDPIDALQTLQCAINIPTQTLRCGPEQPNTGDALGAAGPLITGGQNIYVTLTASGFNADDDPSDPAVDSLSMNVTVRNLMRQALGTVDGATPQNQGVRVFFSQLPVGQPTGDADIVNFDGDSAITTVQEQPYFQYAGLLEQNETSEAKSWVFTHDAATTNIYFKVTVWAMVQHPNGWVEITPPLDTLAPTETVDLNGVAYDRRAPAAPPVSQTLTWSSNNTGVATVDAGTGVVTAHAAGTATITATNGTQSGTATIVVNTQPAFVVDSILAISNVTIVEPAPGLLQGATDPDGHTPTVIPDTTPTAKGGIARISANGRLDYLSKAGFSGRDTIPFTLTDGVQQRAAYAIVDVSAANHWYVATGGTGDGRDRFPFGSIAAAQDSAGVGDTIFVLSSVDGAAVLENDQVVLGGGIPASITRTLNDTTQTLLVGGGTAPSITRATGAVVTLGQNNTLRGVTVTAGGGAAIAGTGFGTLTASDLTASATGPVLDLNNGTASAVFLMLSSSGSASTGMSLANVTGSVTTTGGSISGAAGSAIDVSGGSVSLAYPGNVTQGNSAALLSVSGNHTGTLTFNTGTLSATAGTGLQFNDADGTYNFNGTTTLNGGNAGVDLGNGSNGTFSFASGTSITSPSGEAFSVNGSSPSVTYSGNITQANNALLVSVSEQPGGTVTFQTGTLSATSGTGILLSNADGTVSFNGTTTLNGGDAGVDIIADANGTISFGSGTSITNATGDGLSVLASAPTLTFAGTISTSAGRPVAVDAASPCGSITVSGNVSSTGQGILVQDCNAGSVSFTGASKTLNTGANQGVTLANNTGASINFQGGGLAITTSSGTGFGASLGGTVLVTGANNTINSTAGGIALSLSAVNTSASGVTFRSVSSAGGAASGIVLSGLTGGAGVSVTGDGSTAGSGGTVTGTTGHAVSLNSLTALTTGVTLNHMTVSGGASGNSALFGTSFGTLAATGTTLSATGGPALNLTTGTVNATFTSVASSGSASNGVTLTGVGGTLNTSGGTITGSGAGAAFAVSGGTLAGTIASTITQASNASLLSVAGGHNTGTLTFSGPVSASNGNGLQFTDADGTYTFTGNFTLDGAGDEGIDIGALSAGTINVTPSGGNTASIVSPSGIAIAITGGSADLNYSGNVTQNSNAALLSVTGGHTGDVAFPSGTLTGSNGTGLQFDNADGTYTFSGTVALNGGDAGIDVTNGSAGTFSFPVTATITNPSTGNLISILNSAPSFTYTGGLSKTVVNNVTGILISSNTGGTITFNGDATSADGDPADVARSISSGTAAAVNLSSNTNATINFNGGGLNLTTTSGAGFTATGGGTVNVTGAGNVVSSGTGTALNVQNTTIGASGLSFASISHSGGATGNGIVLENTGALNGMQVTGTGNVAGSGGTITNTQGVDGSTQGAGIYLNNTRAISLAFMALSGHANWAIRGNSVVGFTMNKVRITGTNGTSTATDDGSIYFTELTGSASITGSFIDGGFEDGVLVDNTTGTLNRITFDGDTIGSSSGISGDGMRLEASGGTLNATVQNTRFARAAGDMFQHNIIGNAQSDLDFLNNTMINGHPAISGGGGGVTITAAESGDLTYDIAGNTIRGSKGVALVVNKPFGGSPGNGTMSGLIRNNIIGTAGATQNGSSEGSGMLIGLLAQGTHTTRIEDNQIYDYEEMGIFFNIGGTSQSVTGLAHNGTVNATVVGNIIAEPLNLPGALAQNGIHLNAGTNSDGGNDAYQVCMDIGNASTVADRNTVNGSGAAGGQDIRLRQRFATTVRLPGYGGANNDNAAVQTYVLNRNNNPGTTTAVAANTVSTGGGGFLNTSPAGSACPQP